jgi:hypothetical protein
MNILFWFNRWLIRSQKDQQPQTEGTDLIPASTTNGISKNVTSL